MSQHSARIIARLGLSTDVPVLSVGELGYDTDTKIFRVGDGTSTPPKVLTSKSTGALDFSAATSVKFNVIEMGGARTIDGMSPYKLNQANGILARIGANDFASRSIVSGDSSLSITNPAGTAGNIDVRLSTALQDAIAASGIDEVAHDATLTGLGTVGTPLTVTPATETQAGAVELSTLEEAEAAASTNTALTPKTLGDITSGSNLAAKLRVALQVPSPSNVIVNHDDTMTGQGTWANPLSTKSATTSQAGITRYATVAEAEAGSAVNRALTPAALSSIADDSGMANALRTALALPGFEVKHGNTLTGKGTNEEALQVVAASTVQIGAIRVATSSETGAALSTALAISPIGLASITSNSTLANSLRTTLGVGNVYHDTTLTGLGSEASPLSAAQASEAGRGAIEIAEQAEVNAATDDARAITSLKLASISKESEMGIALRKVVGLDGSGPGYDNPAELPQANYGLLGAVTIATQEEVDAGVTPLDPITPYTLFHLGSSSDLAVQLRTILNTNAIEIEATNSGLDGDGSSLTPLTVVQATTSVFGGVTMADVNDLATGTSTTKAVTPDALADHIGTLWASVEETNAGVLTTKAVTPFALNTYVALELPSIVESQVDTSIASLIDAAPSTLDTLNELAAALGDDPNFATTVTNALASKLNSSSYTAADVLAKLITVDGAGSGLDADLLDGQSGAYYLAWGNLTSVPATISSVAGRSIGVANSTDIVDRAAADTRYAQLATANTFTGDQTVSKAAPSLIINATSVGNRSIVTRTNGLDRWSQVLGNATAEGGANAGSDFALNSYDDAGSLIGAALTITRSNLEAAFGGNVKAPASAYFNFGSLFGNSGYGIRDGAGNIEAKDSGGAWSRVLTYAGGSITGNLSVAKASPILSMDSAAAGQDRILRGLTNTSIRWALALGNSTAEGGANAGSDAVLTAYDDAGASIGAALTVTRSNMQAAFGSNVKVPASGYYNFGATFGDSGYGIKDDAGTIKIKNSGGSWAAITAFNGGTITADLILDEATPSLILDKDAAGQSALIQSKTNGNLRWSLEFGDATAEGGANAGSDLALKSYDDAGTLIETPLTIKRSSGLVSLAQNLKLVASKYLNWGTTEGSSGYGIRDNSGTVEIKHSGGGWAAPLFPGVTANITAGFTFTSYDLGSVGSGTVTPDPANGNHQKLSRTASFTLAAPSSDCDIDLLITNGDGTPGTITFSGFTAKASPGDPFTTTSGHKFIVSIRRHDGTSTYSVYALQ